MSILITGGTGFLGIEIAKILIEDGEHVVLFDLHPDANAAAGIGHAVTITQGRLR
jgi:nucleoside-diphosphate-sugar epimerase